MIKVRFFFLLLVFWFNVSFAQDSIPLQVGGVLEIKGHWFNLQSQDFFSSIQIDGNKLNGHRSGQLSQTLSFLPGISAISTGVGVAKPVIRGFSGARVVVVDNGVRQEGQQWGNDHGLEWDQFSVGNLTIVKGAVGLEYGGDALGGLLIIDHDEWSMQKRSTQLIGLLSSNNRQRGFSAFHQERLDRKGSSTMRMGFRYTRMATDDYKLPVTSFNYLNRTLPLAGGFLSNTASQEEHLTSFVESRFYKKFIRSMKLTYRLNHSKSGLFPGFIGVPTLQSVNGDGDRSNISLPMATNVHQKVLLEFQFKDGDEAIKMNIGFQRSHREELSRPHQPGYVPMNADSLSLQLSLHTTQWNVSKNWSLWNGLKLKTGVQLQLKQNAISGHEFLIPNFNQYQQAFYTTLVTDRRGGLQQFVGIRAEEGGMRIKSFYQPWYKVNLATDSVLTRSTLQKTRGLGWAAQYGWNWRGSKDWSVNLILGKVYRIPQINELAINGIHHGSHRHELGNRSLKWESGYQSDFNVMKEWKNGHGQFTGFVAYYDNFIFLSPQAYFSELPDGGQVYLYQQREVFWAGGEFFTDWHPLVRLSADFALESVYTREVQTGLGLPFIPPVTLKSNLHWICLKNKKHSCTLIIHGRKAYAQQRVARNEKVTPGYFVLNANLEYRYDLDELKVFSLTVQCNNALNSTYYNHLSLYRPMNLSEQGRWIQVVGAVNF